MAKSAKRPRRLPVPMLPLFCLFLFLCRAEPPSLVLCCAGDSIMHPMPLYLRQLLHSPGRKLVLHEWAQGGLSTATYRGFYLEHAEAWRRVRPDGILLQIGTNDVPAILEGRQSLEDFEGGLKKILTDLAAYRSSDGRRTALLVATVPLFSDTPENFERNRLVRSRINPSLRRVARGAGGVIVDNYAVLENKPELYDPDGVHPNSLGEAALARNWTRTLRSLLADAGDGLRPVRR